MDAAGLALCNGAQTARRRLLRIHGFVFARYDQTAVVIIVEIGIIFGDEGVATGLVNDLVLCPDHAHQRGFEYIRSVADGVSDRFVPRRHAVERAMGLNVIERHILGFQEALERTHLVNDAIGQFVTRHFHFATAEALKIGERRMGANRDLMLLGQLDRFAHVVEIRCMESARHVCDRNERHQPFVVADPVEAERLAHIAIDCDHGAAPDTGFNTDAAGYHPRHGPNIAFILTSMTSHDHDHHHHDHDHSELSETELRVRALETILTEKGYVDPAALDAIIQAYETKIGPHNGAQVVAKAWSDPAFKRSLLEDATKAVSTLGHVSRVGDHLVAVENTPQRHNMVVCTLCSCYPWEILGLPPVWYKAAPYRSRAVKDPRGVLADFGVSLPKETEIRVWDSTAETRFLVLPMRPLGTEGYSEQQLTELVTRDSMIGTGFPKTPGAPS